MHLRVMCLLLLGLVFAIAPAMAAELQASDDVRKVFTATAASRETAVAKTSLKVQSPAQDIEYRYPDGGALLESEMARLLDQATEGESASAYREAIRSELTSSNPRSRGLASELAAFMFSTDVIHSLGQIIDDTAPAAPVLNREMCQQGSDRYWWSRPTVGQMARIALQLNAQMRFRSKADFDEWWKANAKYEDKLWYWGAKWSRLRLTPVIFEGERPLWPHKRRNLPAPTRAISESDSARLSTLPPEVTLKILLLCRNYGARQMETSLSFASSPESPLLRAGVEGFGTTDGLPDASAVAAFVNEHHLQTRLMDMLEGRDVYPEAQGGPYANLVHFICLVGEKAFASDDEAALARLQEKNAANEGFAMSLAILRSRLNPESGAAILSKTLTANPKMFAVARALILAYGAQESGALTTAFEQLDKNHQSQMAESVEKAAKAHLPVSAAFLVGLIEKVTEPQGISDRDCLSALASLARTANIVRGSEVISGEDLILLRGPGKVTREEADDQMRGSIEAFARTKQKLVTELRSQ